jgi:uncharacterized cupin superfamily protein
VGYTLLSVDDPAVESYHGRFFKMRRALGTNAFGLNEVRLPAGAEGVDHDEVETGHEEVYVILEGGGHFSVDDTDVPVTAGDYLRIDPSAKRLAVAGDDGLRFLAIAAKPQREYDGRASL